MNCEHCNSALTKRHRWTTYGQITVVVCSLSLVIAIVGLILSIEWMELGLFIALFCLVLWLLLPPAEVVCGQCGAPVKPKKQWVLSRLKSLFMLILIVLIGLLIFDAYERVKTEVITLAPITVYGDSKGTKKITTIPKGKRFIAIMVSSDAIAINKKLTYQSTEHDTPIFIITPNNVAYKQFREKNWHGWDKKGSPVLISPSHLDSLLMNGQ